MIAEQLVALFDAKLTYTEDDYSMIMRKLCLTLHVRLTKQKKINSYMSGSTGVLTLIHNAMIICGNVGDSRAMLVEVEEGSPVLVAITEDMVPTLKGEEERIRRSGGVVRPCVGTGS